MNLRCVDCFRRMVTPVLRGNQPIYRPFLTYMVNTNSWERQLGIRQISTETKSIVTRTGLLQNITNKLKLQFKKYRFRVAGYHLYECIADRIDYATFMKELRMADTFNSWFLITELHVWMLMATLMGNPKYGRYLRNVLVEAMWDDVSTRSKKLGKEQPSIVRQQVQIMSQEFQAALVNYDEGVLSSDTVLAGAIWRRLLSRNPSCTVTDLEAMVKYIRKTMILLDKWDVDDFLKKKKLEWISFSEIYSEFRR